MKTSDFNRVIAVGDCHGHLDKLKDIWNKINIQDDDLVIFLGDYIDRGNDSVECLKFMKELSKRPNVVVLMGNHEAFMRDYFKNDINRTTNDIWLDPRNGGDVTHDQLNELLLEEKKELIDFVSNLPVMYREIDGYIFVHAGIYPRFELDEQDEQDLLWIREEFFENYDGDDIVVIGHTPVQYLGYDVPIIKSNIFFVDTGAAMDRKMSAIDVKTKKFIQSI